MKPAQNIIIPSLMFFAAVSITPAQAEDKSQRDALLDAALQRISALEAKVGRINSLEEENRQLRTKLVKSEKKRDVELRVSSRSLATPQSTIGTTARPYATASSNEVVAANTTLWEGAYAGINAGYGTGNLNTYTNTTTVYKPENSIEEVSNSSRSSYLGGGIAGGQFGYNHVFANRLMLGAEADIDWADVYDSANPNNTGSFTIGHTPRGNPFTPVEGDAAYSSGYGKVGMNWVGTLRGRVGYDLGRFLPYVTAGLAYGEVNSSNHTVNTSINWEPQIPLTIPPVYLFEPTGSYSIGSAGSITAGWAAGAGAEYMVADKWSVKGEYLYTSIGGVTTPQLSQNTEPSDTKAFTTRNTGSFGVHQARIGLNYHPGWSFTEPVLANR